MSYLYKSGKQYGLANITINQNTPTRELTQAQYDALPISEKRNGTIYFIIDANSSKIIVDDPAPIGAILAYGGTTAPDGWLMCDGSLISRTLYSELFAVIGTTYGAGDGSTTFKLPDLRGNVAIGASEDYDLGDTGGEDTHTLIENELPLIDGHLAWHGQEHGTHVYHVYDHFYGTRVASQYQTTGATAGAESWADVGYKFGGDLPHNNMQPYIVTNYIIKAKDTSVVTGTRSGGGSVDSTPIPTATLVAEFDDNAHMNSEDMSTQDINNFVNNIEGQGTNLADYIVEQGTSDIWTYRKWNNGIAECWGTWSGNLTHYGTSFGGYAFYTSVAFPSNFFISAPLVTYSGTVDNSFCLTGTVLNLSKDHTNCYAISGSSGTQPVNFYLNCKGRWK